jgi:hypothetical protein
VNHSDAAPVRILLDQPSVAGWDDAVRLLERAGVAVTPLDGDHGVSLGMVVGDVAGAPRTLQVFADTSRVVLADGREVKGADPWTLCALALGALRPPGSPTRPSALKPCALLGRFLLRGVIGRGGAGEVWQAIDVDHGCTVALKLIPAERVADAAAFRREFRTTSALAHPNLVRLYELFCVDDRWFFTMELVRGQPWSPGAASDQPPVWAERFDQLAAALEAVHAAGVVHLDVKPSNVMTAADGRVVLLDLGISRPLGAPLGRVRIGTPGFIAPEVGSGAAPGAAADWFSFAATVHLVAHGRPAGIGQSVSPGPALSREGAAALTGMLDPDPTRRGRWPGTPTSNLASGPTRHVGREGELARLDAMWAGAADGGRLVLAVAPSGVGKTHLVERWVETLIPEAARVVRGRCFAREFGAYRALEGMFLAIDRCEPAEAPDAATLAELAVLRGAGEGPATVGIGERWRRGVDALAAALRSIAGGRDLLLFLDDAQWADADSGRVLGELLSRPDGPIRMAVLTARPDGLETPFFAELRARIRAPIQHIPVPPLPERDAAALLVSLGVAPDEASGFGSFAQGNPYFLQELARQRASAGRGTAGVEQGAKGSASILDGPDGDRPPRGAIGELVRARAATLGDSAIALLQVIAVAARPVPIAVAASVASVQAPLSALSELHAAHLIALTDLRPGSSVRCWHDQVGAAFNDVLGAQEARSLHGRLAGRWERHGDAPADALAEHYYAAGERAPALRAARSAASEAEGRTAFLQAASWFERVMAWSAEEGREDDDALADRARVLALAGHRARAADDLLVLAERRRAPELRRAAGALLFSAGHVDRGRAAMRPSFTTLGLHPPEDGAWSAMRSVAQLIAAWLPGRADPEARALAAERAALCWDVARGLLPTDSFRGLYLAVLGLRWAARSGSAELQARLLAVVGSVVLMPLGGAPGQWGASMLTRARALADRPIARGVVAVGEVQARTLDGDWPGVLEACEAVEREFQAAGPSVDVAWERAIATMGRLRALEELGRFGEAREAASAFRSAARETEDRYAEVTGLQYEAMAELAADRVDAARALLDRAEAAWPYAGFQMQHMYALRLRATLDLYVGDPAAAQARVRAAWGQVNGSGLLMIKLVWFDAWDLRARAEMSAGGAARAVSTLDGGRLGFAPAWAAVLRAGLDGRPPDHAVVAELERRQLYGRAAVARWVVARLTGDDRALTDARAALRSLGIVDPDRWARAQVPLAQLRV